MMPFSGLSRDAARRDGRAVGGGLGDVLLDLRPRRARCRSRRPASPARPAPRRSGSAAALPSVLILVNVPAEDVGGLLDDVGLGLAHVDAAADEVELLAGRDLGLPIGRVEIDARRPLEVLVDDLLGLGLPVGAGRTGRGRRRRAAGWQRSSLPPAAAVVVAPPQRRWWSPGASCRRRAAGRRRSSAPTTRTAGSRSFLRRPALVRFCMLGASSSCVRSDRWSGGLFGRAGGRGSACHRDVPERR